MWVCLHKVHQGRFAPEDNPWQTTRALTAWAVFQALAHLVGSAPLVSSGVHSDSGISSYMSNLFIESISFIMAGTKILQDIQFPFWTAAVQSISFLLSVLVDLYLFQLVHQLRLLWLRTLQHIQLLGFRALFPGSQPQFLGYQSLRPGCPQNLLEQSGQVVIAFCQWQSVTVATRNSCLQCSFLSDLIEWKEK